MKRTELLFLLLLIAVVIPLSGCGGKNSEAGDELRAVKVLKVASISQSVQKMYVGTVDARELTEYSFKSGGKIARIYFDKGDQVKKGDKLAELDQSDLQYGLETAQATMASAATNIKKAEVSLNYSNNNLEKMEKLYQAGAISQDQYDQVVLQNQLAAASLSQAREQYQAARAGFGTSQESMAGSVIYAEQDGYVADVMHEENERVGRISDEPVISVRSLQQVINIGIPQQDLQVVHVGSKVVIEVDGAKTAGVIDTISEIPDAATRTYEAEVLADGTELRLGSIANVTVDTGMESGIWIPMAAVFSDGADYVFIVRDERVFKRSVELLKVSNDQIMVKGIKSGEMVAVSGMKNLDDGSLIKIVKEK